MQIIHSFIVDHWLPECAAAFFTISHALGFVCDLVNDQSPAVEFYNKALPIRSQLGDRERLMLQEDWQ